MSGITDQDTIMVHSSMSKMGYLVDGPKTIISAFQEILSPTGLLILPSFPHNNMFNYLESGHLFNLLTTDFVSLVFPIVGPNGLITFISTLFWCARKDSNPQPSDPKSDALSS